MGLRLPMILEIVLPSCHHIMHSPPPLVHVCQPFLHVTIQSRLIQTHASHVQVHVMYKAIQGRAQQ